MAILFLDSSAIAKSYVTEQGSQWIRAMLDPAAGNEHPASVVAGVEVISAIIRRRRIGNLDATTAAAAISEFLDDWEYLYGHVAINERLIDIAMIIGIIRFEAGQPGFKYRRDVLRQPGR